MGMKVKEASGPGVEGKCQGVLSAQIPWWSKGKCCVVRRWTWQSKGEIPGYIGA